MDFLSTFVSDLLLDENDIVYLSGLSKDVSFILFLSFVGEKAVEWILTKNVGLPMFDLSKDVLRLERKDSISERQHLHAMTALRMLSPASARNNHTLQIGIYACIQAWLQGHMFQ